MTAWSTLALSLAVVTTCAAIWQAMQHPGGRRRRVRKPTPRWIPPVGRLSPRAAALAGLCLLMPARFVPLILGAAAVMTIVSGRRRRAANDRAAEVEMATVARRLADQLAAGRGLERSLTDVAAAAPGPLREPLSVACLRARLGEAPATALQVLVDRYPCPQSRRLVHVIALHCTFGGPLAHHLARLAEQISADEEERRELDAAVVAVRYATLLVPVMAVGTLLLLNQMEPGLVGRMAGHPVGQLALFVGGGLFTVGFVMVRRITRIER